MTETRETKGRDGRVSLGPDFKITRPRSIGGPRKESRPKSKPIDWWADRINNFQKEGSQFAGECPVHDDQDMLSLKMLPVDGPALTAINCQAGCEYDDIFDAVKDIEPGIISKPSPVITKKKKAEPKKITIKAESPDGRPSDDGPVPPEEDKSTKKSRVTITHKDDSGEEVGMGERWACYVNVPWQKCEEIGTSVSTTRIRFGWEGFDVVKERTLDGKKYEQVPSKVPVPPFWPLYPEDESPEQIILTEGESDTTVLRHLGYEAFTKSTKKELQPVIWQHLHNTGLNLAIVMYDIDGPGQEQARTLIESISRIPEIKIIQIDLSSELRVLRGEKDVRDLWLRVNDIDEMRTIIQSLVDKALDEQRLDVRSGAHIMTVEREERVWVLPEIVPIGLTLLAGLPKTGKSYFALNLMKEVTSGGQFLGIPTESRKTLYLDFEDDEGDLAERLEEQGWAENELEKLSVLTMNDFPIGFDLSLHYYQSLLFERIKEMKIEFCTIDTIALGMGLDHIDYTEVLNVLNVFRLHGHQYGIAYLGVDHMRKADPEFPNVILDTFGSVAKSATVDSIIGLYELVGGAHHLLQVRGKRAERKDWEVIMDRASMTWELARRRSAFEVKISMIKLTAKQRTMIDAVKELEPVTLEEMSEHLKEQEGNVYARLEALIKKGCVTKGVHKGRTRYFVSPSYREKPKSNQSKEE